MSEPLYPKDEDCCEECGRYVEYSFHIHPQKEQPGIWVCGRCRDKYLDKQLEKQEPEAG